MQYFVVTCFIGCLDITESVASELIKLHTEIFGKDSVYDETNPQKNIFIALVLVCLFESFLAFFDQILAKKVGLLTLKLVVLCQRLSFAAVLGLSDTLL